MLDLKVKIVEFSRVECLGMDWISSST